MEKDQMTQVKSKDLSHEEFKELAKDLKPVIKTMEEVLKKHSVECITSMTMSTDGYFHFSVHDSGWEFKRLDSNEKALICRCISEEV